MKLNFSIVFSLVVAWVLVGCVTTPQPEVADKVEEKEVSPLVSVPEKPVAPVVPDDGLRVGNLMVMPKETEYRSTQPAGVAEGPGAAVVSAPPLVAPKPPKSEGASGAKPE